MAGMWRSFQKQGCRMAQRMNNQSNKLAMISNNQRNLMINGNNMNTSMNCKNNTNNSINNNKNSVRLFSNNFYHPLWSDSTMSSMNNDGIGYNNQNYNSIPIRSTTIICVRKNDEVVLMGDGQMTIGSTVAKPNAKKLRKLNNNRVICGFAGAAADGISLVDLLEKKLSERDELRRACVETTKLWRTDKILRHLNALIIVADEKSTFELTGSGELVESDTGIIAIGSGGHYAEAAARALMDSELTAEQIAEKAMKIAGDMCVYTNHNTMKLKIIKGQGIVNDETPQS